VSLRVVLGLFNTVLRASPYNRVLSSATRLV